MGIEQIRAAIVKITMEEHFWLLFNRWFLVVLFAKNPLQMQPSRTEDYGRHVMTTIFTTSHISLEKSLNSTKLQF